MIRLLYYLVLKPLSFLPLPVLYGFANFIYLGVYKIFGYRKEVVQTNLRNSFPDKTEVEIEQIASRFYHFLTDFMVESIWTFSLNEKRIKKRFKLENPELVDHYFDQNRSVILILGHYSSWELVLSSLNLFVKHQVETIYIPLTNAGFDKYFLRMRTKFNSIMIPKKDFKASFENTYECRAIIFGADQSPSISKNLHWTEFLNQDTAVALGAEKYAIKYDMPVIFAHLYPRKKGYYNLNFKLVTDTPQETKPGEITEGHVRVLEKIIRERPEYWLWSHKRWKKKRDQ